MFTVTSAINISDVGIFDDSAIAGLSSAGSVSIVSLNNNNVSSPFPLTVLGSYVVPAGTTDLNGGYSYVPTGGLVLGPGSYAIYVTSLDAADTIKWFSSTPSFAGNVGLGYSGDISGSLAAGIVGIGSRYEVANFRYSVPEPETYAMVAGVGLVAFGLWRRRQ